MKSKEHWYLKDKIIYSGEDLFCFCTLITSVIVVTLIITSECKPLLLKSSSIKIILQTETSVVSLTHCNSNLYDKLNFYQRVGSHKLECKEEKER